MCFGVYLFQLIIKIGHIQVHGWLRTRHAHWKASTTITATHSVFMLMLLRCVHRFFSFVSTSLTYFSTLSTMRTFVLFRCWNVHAALTIVWTGFAHAKETTTETMTVRCVCSLNLDDLCHLLSFIINVLRWTMRPKMKPHWIRWQKKRHIKNIASQECVNVIHRNLINSMIAYKNGKPQLRSSCEEAIIKLFYFRWLANAHGFN